MKKITLIKSERVKVTGGKTDLRFGDRDGDGGWSCKRRKGKRKEEETGSDFETEHCLRDSRVLITEERKLRLEGVGIYTIL